MHTTVRPHAATVASIWIYLLTCPGYMTQRRLACHPVFCSRDRWTT